MYHVCHIHCSWAQTIWCYLIENIVACIDNIPHAFPRSHGYVNNTSELSLRHNSEKSLCESFAGDQWTLNKPG